jgi:hypothetical protein
MTVPVKGRLYAGRRRCPCGVRLYTGEYDYCSDCLMKRAAKRNRERTMTDAEVALDRALCTPSRAR